MRYFNLITFQANSYNGFVFEFLEIMEWKLISLNIDSWRFDYVYLDLFNTSVIDYNRYRL